MGVFNSRTADVGLSHSVLVHGDEGRCQCISVTLAVFPDNNGAL